MPLKKRRQVRIGQLKPLDLLITGPSGLQNQASLPTQSYLETPQLGQSL